MYIYIFITIISCKKTSSAFVVCTPNVWNSLLHFVFLQLMSDSWKYQYFTWVFLPFRDKSQGFPKPTIFSHGMTLLKKLPQVSDFLGDKDLKKKWSTQSHQAGQSRSWGPLSNVQRPNPWISDAAQINGLAQGKIYKKQGIVTPKYRGSYGFLQIVP